MSNILLYFSQVLGSYTQLGFIKIPITLRRMLWPSEIQRKASRKTYLKWLSKESKPHINQIGFKANIIPKLIFFG